MEYKQSMSDRMSESRGMERYETKKKMKGELGHAAGMEEIKPFDFQGSVKELPMNYLGTNKKAFDYEY